jgi:glycerophosphoryl diester phosphodiesterase
MHGTKMKRRSLITLLFTLFVMHGIAQQPLHLYLSGYTFRHAGDAMAIRLSNGAEPGRIRLSGKDSKFFKAEGRRLTLTRTPGDAKKWLDVKITATSGTSVISEEFRLVRDEFIRTPVVAHRGAWKHTGAPQNSLASLTKAIEMGCAGSEFDIHMSSDSGLFINHDPHFNGVSLEQASSAELQKLQLTNGETLGTLREFLELGMRQNRTRLVLEIKPSAVSPERGIATARKVAELVRSMNAEAWCDYISFDYEICRELTRLAPYALVAYLKGDKTPAQVAADGIPGIDYHYSTAQKNPALLSEARDNRLSINMWTVNDNALQDWLLAEKINFITTDEPEQLIGKLGRP